MRKMRRLQTLDYDDIRLNDSCAPLWVYVATIQLQI